MVLGFRLKATMGVKIDNLTIGYNRRAVASDIYMHARQGTLSCLIGENGSGKSTLLRTIAGLLAPIRGNVFIGEENICDCSGKHLARLVSIVPTGRAETGRITVRQLVALGRQPYTNFFDRLTASDNDIIDSALDTLKIAELQNRMIADLSDGEYQKAMTARALAQQTAVVLLDEPTAFLDYRSKISLMQSIMDLAHRDKRTVIITTHDIHIALDVADDIYIMQGKTLLHCKTEDDIRRYIGDVI